MHPIASSNFAQPSGFFADFQIVFLHCLAQAITNGETFFSDGFQVAQHLQGAQPRLFDVLSDVEVTWASRGFDVHSGATYHHETKHPVLK